MFAILHALGMLGAAQFKSRSRLGAEIYGADQSNFRLRPALRWECERLAAGASE